MNLTKKIITLVLCMIPLSPVFCQQDLLERKVTIRFENQPVNEALEKLLRKTNITINYRPSEIPKERIIKKYFEQQPLGEIIKEVWGSKELVFRSRGNTISIQSILEKSMNNTRGNIQCKVLDDKNVPIGIREIEASFLGFEKITKTVTISERGKLKVDFSLQPSVSEMEEVLIESKSITTEIAEAPITINTVDALKLQAQTQDVAKVLDKVEGVRIRQSGGLGSTTSISINGLTGNAIRFYYNGIPSEFLGGGFQLNTLPISNVDRIEVYKGVMPANIGTDALGGGIHTATNTYIT